MVAPGQPKDAVFPGEFITPSSGGKKEQCEDTDGIESWGEPSQVFSYILKSSPTQEGYPEDACLPYYHHTAQIDELRVNTHIEGPKESGQSENYRGDLWIKTSRLLVSNGGGTSSIVLDGGMTAEGVVCAAAVNSSGAITSPVGKCFDIPHPLKSNKRLVYACLEGPETGVYVRGRLTNSNIIDLPDYWIKLVDPESITVSLTQIGYTQDLIVEKIEWGTRVIIKSGNGANIDCYYNVMGTRNDIPPLEVERDA
jgi:hypothetical protein